MSQVLLGKIKVTQTLSGFPAMESKYSFFFFTGDQSKQTFGDLLCGYDISKVENSDGGKDLTGASSQLKGFTEMLKRQEQELAEMPG